MKKKTLSRSSSVAATSSEARSRDGGDRGSNYNNRRNNGDNRNRRNNRGPNGGRGGQAALKLVNPLKIQRIAVAPPPRRERQPRDNNNDRRPRQVASAETGSDGKTTVKGAKSKGASEFGDENQDDSSSRNRSRSGGRYAAN